jgi:2-octaprenyl-6-methoxyphenol hydroxylase
VWTLRDDQVDAVMALDDAAFLARLQERFGQRLGRLMRVGKRAAYPLRLVRACESVRPRLALIGNAAHTLHPIAGQGFNLGLRDVAALAEVVLEAQREVRDIGELALLQRYADWRQGDHRRVIAFTDGLTRIFTNPLPPVAWTRDLGMLALDLCPPAKRIFAKLTMGRAGRLPRLARGLEL